MPTRLNPSDQALALLYHARSATPFFSQGGQPCASVPAGIDSHRVLPLRSADFRDWLTANFYSEFETAPSALALRVVLRTLEARAQNGDSRAQKVDHRVSFEGDPFAPSKIFVDLANVDGEILEITAQGWTVTNNLRQSFRQSPGMLPLPNPQTLIPNPLSGFAALFNLSSIARTLVFTWLTAALRPTGPYPILVLRGPAASGKSVLARALRTLTDPSAAPRRLLPNHERELLRFAMHNWILVFDQVHRIPIKISEALCAISSGEAIETAQTDYRDNALAEIARPIILVAPLDEAEAGAQHPWTPTRSLSNRSITVDLAAIAAPRPEAVVWSELEALRAPALAALADAVSSALRHVRDIDPGHVARFPDSVAWAAAASPVLGLDPAAIVDAVSDQDSMWVPRSTLRHRPRATPKAAPQSAWSPTPNP